MFYIRTWKDVNEIGIPLQNMEQKIGWYSRETRKNKHFYVRSKLTMVSYWVFYAVYTGDSWWNIFLILKGPQYHSYRGLSRRGAELIGLGCRYRSVYGISPSFGIATYPRSICGSGGTLCPFILLSLDPSLDQPLVQLPRLRHASCQVIK